MSGGRDSLALLHLTACLARHQGLRVAALHVHHGLQADADEWERRLRQLCEQWAREGLPVDCRASRLQGTPARGESVEAWARRGRYAALATMAREAGASLVLLGHHRGDQTETVLLQALRGAGPAGLAAMPRLRQRDGLTWARPWLDQPRSRIEAYVTEHGVPFVEDRSNADTRHARNRLRHTVMPALRAAFPGVDAAFAAVARRAAEARELAEALVSRELPALLEGDALGVEAWRQQPEAWRGELLRAWLASVLPAGAPDSLVDRLRRELPARHGGRWPAPGGELRLHRGRLTHAPAPAAGERGSCAELPAPLLPGRHELPSWRAVLVVERAETGIEPALLAGAQWRPRQGGEQFQRVPGAPPRQLKKQFQAAGVPAWERDAPLLWSAHGQLLFVPALGIDARALAAPGAAQLALRWLPAADEGRAGPPTSAA